MNRFCIRSLTAMLVLAVAISSAAARTESVKPADPRPAGRPVFTFEVGDVFGGDVNVDNQRAGTTGDGLSLGVGIEFPSRGWIASGLNFDQHKVTPETGTGDANFWNVGLTLKRALKNDAGSPVIRPGFELGYGRVSALGYDFNFITYKGFVELDVVSKSGLGFLVEFGIIAAPYGKPEGIAVTKITAEPRPIIRTGVLFR